jgi:hypothetical protein
MNNFFPFIFLEKDLQTFPRFGARVIVRRGQQKLFSKTIRFSHSVFKEKILSVTQLGTIFHDSKQMIKCSMRVFHFSLKSDAKSFRFVEGMDILEEMSGVY